MGIDIKFPIGLMFSILGLLISVYGLFTMNNPIYQKSFGININLWMGVGMLIFGVVMLLLVKRKPKSSV